jgi:hypothetical protein
MGDSKFGLLDRPIVAAQVDLSGKLKSLKMP